MLIEIERQLEGPLIPAGDLESYGRRACQLPNRTLACTYALGTDSEGRWAVFRELAPASGVALDDLRRRPLDVSVACSMALSVTEALAALHEAGLRGCRPFQFDTFVHLTRGDDESEWYLRVHTPSPGDIFTTQTATGDVAVSPADDSYGIGLLMADLLSMPDAPETTKEEERTLLAFSLKARKVARTDVPDELASAVRCALDTDPGVRPSLAGWASLLRRFGAAALSKPEEPREPIVDPHGERLRFRTVVSKLDRPLDARVMRRKSATTTHCTEICVWVLSRLTGAGPGDDSGSSTESAASLDSNLSETSFDTAPDTSPSSIVGHEFAPIRPASTSLPIDEHLTPPTIDGLFEPFASPIDSVPVAAPRAPEAKEETPVPPPSIPEFPPSLNLPDEHAPLSQAPAGDAEAGVFSMQNWSKPLATPRGGRRRHGHIARWGSLAAMALVLVAALYLYRQTGGGAEVPAGREAEAPVETSHADSRVTSAESHFPAASPGDNAFPEIVAQSAPPEGSRIAGSRVLVFPKTQSIGLVYVRPAESRDARDWQKWSEARGDVRVNAEVAVLLVINTADLSPLIHLETDAIDALQLNNPAVSDVDTDYIRRFTSLKAIDIRNTRISSAMASRLESSLPGCVVLK